MQHPDQLRWNRKYEAKGMDNLNPNPSDWLLEHQRELNQQSKGIAIDIACGNGRNSLFLAEMGYEVDAVDISNTAIDWLKSKVEHLLLPVYPVCRNLTPNTLRKAYYQVVCNFYFLERQLFPEIERSLVSGGLLFFETFTEEHLNFHPSMPSKFCLKKNELLHAFPSLHILHYQETILNDHTDQARAVARLLAKKN